ncbi:hypothetical protein DGG96_03580 [Legionella qingyii]|uniref:Uncharacterized protein n=1 Tax=Legionella qingyii TaxID=2184757 RepID=A0A317U6I2_9GAMM|nr:hypothetical protein DGG96_03580 [Legionella qingyii]
MVTLIRGISCALEMGTLGLILLNDHVNEGLTKKVVVILDKHGIGLSYHKDFLEEMGLGYVLINGFVFVVIHDFIIVDIRVLRTLLTRGSYRYLITTTITNKGLINLLLDQRNRN